MGSHLDYLGTLCIVGEKSGSELGCVCWGGGAELAKLAFAVKCHPSRYTLVFKAVSPTSVSSRLERLRG